ncbi:MAG: thiopurine S-methyltransferase [Deltaproteobacteria bacterium]|nr:thiopurine S-methyltransferase [Deltaproteobacteria bacterium]MDQ3299600.1 thiopurine S-methyltransferase [Myxococcota bacterium]
MDPAFWHARWQERRIGFHEGRANSYLERHARRLADHLRVLVPLCGKAEDLAFLAGRGHAVVGIELVESAVREFFTEHDLEPTITPRDALVEYTTGPFRLLAGDLFAATPELVGPVDAIYDRAAMIALPADLRRRYVDHLRTFGARQIVLVTFETEQLPTDGPPFSVDDAEIRALYPDAIVELVDEGPDPRPRDKPALERCYAITL